jgi:hypothetical protein
MEEAITCVLLFLAMVAVFWWFITDPRNRPD